MPLRLALFFVISVLTIVGFLVNLGDSGHALSAIEGELGCPETLAGLTLIPDDLTAIHESGTRSEFQCKFALNPSPTVLAQFTVTWTENGTDQALLNRCGFPPTFNPGFFQTSGTFYGLRGQASASYEGRGRFEFSMQSLAAKLATAAASVSEPCPGREIISVPGEPVAPVLGAPDEPVVFNQPSGVPGRDSITGLAFDETDEGAAVIGTITAGRSQFGPDFDESAEGKAAIATLDAGRANENSEFKDSDETASALATLTAGRAESGPEFDDSAEGKAAIATLTAARSQGGPDPVGAANVAAGFCVVHGRVTDSQGAGVPLIRLSVQDSAGATVAVGSTSERGDYAFSQPVEIEGRVTLTPTDGGRLQSIFYIFAEQSDVTLSRELSNISREGVCEVNFDAWNLDSDFAARNLDRWPSIIALYQNFNRAVELAISLGAPIDYGLPIPVYAWCDAPELFCDPAGTAEFAFYSGSTPGRTVAQPYIALGFPTSEISYRGVPDNREYHEFGHAFFADVFGDEIPLNVGDTNHGGYYRNQKTTDSLIEGLAEFYSVMVSKHIDEEQNPQRYRIGAEYDIEADRNAWESVGWWEEFTLAGLLLDFEDGPEDYSSPPSELAVESVTSLTAKTGSFAIGRIRNNSASVARNPEVTVGMVDDSGNTVFRQVTAVTPESLGPGQTGLFYVAVPEDVDFNDVVASVGRPTAVDDDDINLDLSELMRIITSDWGREPERITTVQGLYRSLSDALVGKDSDNDGFVDATQEEIDSIFIKHGFFDDLNGDHRWDSRSDGVIGGTGHPKTTIGGAEYPDITQRSSAVGFSGSFVDVDVVGTDAELLVQIESANAGESYGYWIIGGTDSEVELAVPSSSADKGIVTVIVVSEDHLPAVGYRITAEQYHAVVDSGEIENQPVRSVVELEEGDVVALLGAASNDGPSGGGVAWWKMMIPVALAGLMLAIGYYLMRRVKEPTIPSETESEIEPEPEIDADIDEDEYPDAA